MRRACAAAAAAAALLLHPTARADAMPRAAADPAATAPWLGPALGLSTLDADALAARLQQPFDTPLPARLSAAAGGQLLQLRHCADWLQHRSQVVGSDNDAAWRVLRLQVVVCDALARLQRAAPAQRSALPRTGQAPTLADTRRWPATLWPAPSRDEAAVQQRAGATLRSVSGVDRWRLQAGGVRVLATRERRVELTELARADVDGDGWQDWLLLWQGQLLQGSWTDARLVVLTRRGPAEALREAPSR